jgi:uncharacterized protein
MRLDSDGAARYSPTDLIAYLESDFAAWCERCHAEEKQRPGAHAADPDMAPDKDAQLAIASRHGQAHELRILESLRATHPDLVEIARNHDFREAVQQTEAALRSGASIIYQAALLDGNWWGYPDFLERTDGTSKLGAFHYAPVDTKLARSAKPYFLVQLSAYAEMLETLQGVRPEHLGFLLGDGAREEFPTQDFIFYYRRLKQSFIAFQDAWQRDARPDPATTRNWGHWSGYAEALLAKSDSLYQVASISLSQARKLSAAGIATMTDLAGTTLPRVAHLEQDVFERLRDQARLQLESRGAVTPAWRLREPESAEARHGLARLPAPSPLDIFFDLEGYPYAERGLEYLFGAVTCDRGTPEFHDWWAHDDAEEQRAFEEFLDWVAERRQRDPSLHIYHYAPYESTALRRLMGKHGTREDALDDLLRGEVFVDLYAVVRQALLVGTPSYSLKDIELLYGEHHQGDVKTAEGSVVAYDDWLQSGQPRDWHASRILADIRSYNETDCRSTWKLRNWLLERQRESRIAFIPRPGAVAQEAADKPPETTGSPRVRAAALREQLLDRARDEETADSARAEVSRLLAGLVGFHAREAKPVWWRYYDRCAMTTAELIEDPDCLGGLTATGDAPRVEKRSLVYSYRFDPGQDSRLAQGDVCFIPGTNLKPTLLHLDLTDGIAGLKLAKGTPPEQVNLIPGGPIKTDGLEDALAEVAEAWLADGALPRPLEHLLFRRSPAIAGLAAGDHLVSSGSKLELEELVERMEGTTLCIQGPPGTGKTHTAAKVIAHLLRQGKRIGVTATSHKVIHNLMEKVVETGAPGSFYKAGGQFSEAEKGRLGKRVSLIPAKEAGSMVAEHPVLIGATAWVFCRPEMTEKLDYLFIDEAGQFSLANTVASGRAAANLVLIGDQMQLTQPMQGTHPDGCGCSCLDHLLQNHATVPPDRGILLEQTWRLSPPICRFISDTMYDGRLKPAPETGRYRLIAGAETTPPADGQGLCWLPVSHEGCSQHSEDEAEAIVAMVQRLLGCQVTDRHGGPRPVTMDDIMIVAPFNRQVRLLKTRLEASARVGSVDLFQGQEAPVTIYSLCSSTLDDTPRGAAFLLDHNRMNVAISRAQALAIVIGSPRLLTARCSSIEEMRLVNRLCRLVEGATAV